MRVVNGQQNISSSSHFPARLLNPFNPARHAEDARDSSLLPHAHIGSGSIQAPSQWVFGAPSSEVRQPGQETDHSPSSGAEIKNVLS
jgi:hypothetical protein